MSGANDRSGQLPAVKQAIVELRKMRARLAEAERARTEPIAIVGMGLRFPGGAVDPDSFWRLLDDGHDAIVEVPADRWDLDAYLDARADAPGKMSTRHGGFVGDVDRFDPAFFGIAPKEAVSMDPQHRLLLEVAWEALEHAGFSPSSIAGSETGVYIGLSNSDYNRMIGADPSAIDAYYSLGTTSSVAAGRLSYLLGLHGPSMAIDTACSSSLVAVHLACQSLRLGECDAAIAGGVNLILSPELNINFSKARMLAPDGHCKTFDAAADGYVRGEGCGVVVLKRLSDALKDGDRIAAVVRGSAVNQDGRSSGLTAPNGPAQEAVIRRALKAAGVSGHDIQYVEAHGTGTSLGDPIEVNALANVLCKDRPASSPLLVGSVKTNIGHLEAAAGVAGLIKVALSMQQERIPRHLNFSAPNPHVAWDQMALRVTAQPVAWPAGAAPRLAGVSSFGFSGTNAHLVVEEAPASIVEPNAVDRPKHLLALSARTEPALRTLAGRFAAHLHAHPDLPAADICFTANAGRAHHEHRLAIACEILSDLPDRLDEVARGHDENKTVVRGETADGQSPRVVFMFPGQGAQYFAMGRELYDTQPAFRRVIDECDALLAGQLDRRLVSILFEPAEGETGALNQTRYTQPALFAVEYALAQLWRSWGVEPAVVLGHSLGEDVAACVAGVFSLADGLRLMAIRGRLMQNLERKGAMASVFAPEARVRQAIAAAADVSVAAVNGPEHIVISGPVETVLQLVHDFEANGVKARRLTSPCACHSPLMDPILGELERALGEVKLSRPTIPFVSNVTGAMAEGDEIATPAYWCRHVRECVRFHDGIDRLRGLGHSVFLEVGPGSTLIALGRRCWPGEDHVWLPSLKEGKSDWTEMIASLSSLYAHGVNVDWVGFDRDYARRKLALPTYPFQRQRYWMPVKASPTPAARGVETAREFGVENAVFDVTWRPVESSQPGAAVVPAGGWLVFADASGVGAEIGERLRAHGRQVTLIYASGSPAPAGSRSVEPEDGEALAGAVRDALANQGSLDIDIRNVVYLWAIDEADIETEEGRTDKLDGAFRRTCGAVVEIVRGLSKRGQAAKPARLWLVTRGAQAIEGPASAMATAPLWGLGSVIAREHPELGSACVDLDPAVVRSKAAADVLWAELARRDGESRVAFRGGRRLAARLDTAAAFDAGLRQWSLRNDRTYLITGGTGSLGAALARHLVRRGARTIVLAGRREQDDAITRLLGEVHGAGGQAVYVRADVSRAAAVDRLFAGTLAELPPLAGIVHAAGVLDDGLVMQQTRDRFARVLAPKALGAWHLHRACVASKTAALDFFLLFSSASGILGTPGQANYAAANAFLDALALTRRDEGLPATTINWGPWAEGGMAATVGERDRRRWSDAGIRQLPTEVALDALDRVMASGRAQSLVMLADWNRFAAHAGEATRTLFADLVERPAGTPLTQDAPLRSEIESASPNRRRNVIASHVREQVRQALGLEASARLDGHQGLRELGMDSLMAVDLRQALQRSSGEALSATVAFDYPTIDALTDYLAGLFIAEAQDAAAGGEEAPAVDSVRHVEDLSDEEVDRLFAEKIAGKGI